MSKGRLGIAVIGVGGAVGTTMVAAIELLKQGLVSKAGLPLAESDADFYAYEDIVFAGWDLSEADLADAAAEHGVLTEKQFLAVKDQLSNIRPWKAVGNKEFLTNVEGTNVADPGAHRQSISAIRDQLASFAAGCGNTVVVNLASTEKLVDTGEEAFETVEAFEAAIESDSPLISPAMLYAYAAILEGIPYGNFTPSAAVDIPALIRLAAKKGVPVAGKDGKTGQTFLKTVLAPALRSRALKVDGWYSTNLLGNRDGLALANEESLASKVKSKHSALRSILGYDVDDHIVDIRYYRPRGDDKEAWDSIDVTGFLDQRMQIKVNFLCKDSILAAPLAIEMARCLDLASRRGEKGIQEQLSVFFKMPMSADGNPEHAFHKQEELLLRWLES